MSTFLRGSSAYIVANLINAASPFLLIPLFTRFLPKEEFGKVSMFLMMYMGLSAFIGFNSVGAANRKYYDNQPSEDIANYNSHCFIILTASVCVLLILSFLFSEDISKILNVQESWVYLSLLVGVTIYILQFRLGQWQVREKAKYYSLLQIFNSISAFLLTILLIFTYTKSGESRVLSLSVVGIITSFFCIWSLYKDDLLGNFKFDKNIIKDIMSFGLPLVPHVFGIFLLNSIDRAIISESLGLEKLAIYALASQLSLGVVVLFDAINKAYVPWLFQRLKENNYDEKVTIVKNTYIYFIALIILCIPVIFLADYLIIIIAGDSYRESGKLFVFLFIGQIFVGMYLMVTNYLFYAKKTGILSVITLFSACLQVLLSVYLLSIFGLVGVAYAFSISLLIRFILVWYYASKYVAMPWVLPFNSRDKK